MKNMYSISEIPKKYSLNLDLLINRWVEQVYENRYKLIKGTTIHAVFRISPSPFTFVTVFDMQCEKDVIVNYIKSAMSDDIEISLVDTLIDTRYNRVIIEKHELLGFDHSAYEASLYLVHGTKYKQGLEEFSAIS